ncbi:hypothetical protein D3C79_737350 [compost metagenome]
MVLDHVAQLPGLVEVAPAPLDPDLFGYGDFHVRDRVLVPLGFEQAVGKAQGNKVLDGFLAQVVVDAIDAVFREILRHRVIDPPRRVQVMADGFFQHHPRARTEADLVEVLANTAIDCRRRGEVSDQLAVVADLFGQRLVVLDLEEVDMQIAQAREKALQHQGLDLPLRNKLAQMRLDRCQVLFDTARLTCQGQHTGISVQQVGAIELVKRRKQLAQGQVAEGAKQGKGARFNADRCHDVGSFIKLT